MRDDELTVADVQGHDDILFIMDKRQVKALDELLDVDTTERHSYFVKLESGQYTEAYLMHGFIPYKQRQVIKIK